MNDTIYRQVAINAVHKNYDTILDFKSDGRTVADSFEDIINDLPSVQPEPCEDVQHILDYLDNVVHPLVSPEHWIVYSELHDMIASLPSAQSKIIRCRDCKHWRRQTNYAKAPLSFGFCESDDMWRSLYGETYEVSHIDTDDDFYCGYAERREE